MIATLWGRIQAALLTLMAVVLVLFGAYALGGRAARKATEQKTQRRTIEAARERSDVEMRVDRQPDGAAAERLRNEWSRD
ncbi:hypothetical protein [Pseudomonas citronellolis]|uniref:hypothetical protein n=1 Tax=Pseudomonas citronellolis TaxID=53408 RepID=UPI00094592CD|nr:hypothetical protein [Pseudomonas citronellolis]